jgi:ABC-2 type transport system permease protein/lipopolysaccharide transport system permease protein
MHLSTHTLPEEPPEELRFRRKMNLVVFARQAWRSRVLALTLSERELRVRYKQALLGAAWAFAAPLGYVLVFTVFFDRTANIETFGRPYPVFAYAAIIPWGFFAQSLGRATTSVVDNLVLMNKVACPRETFVLSAISTAFVDMIVSAIAFPIVVLSFGEGFYGATIYLLPIVVLQIAFALGVALLIGSILIYVRDIRHLLGLTTQLLMFATPVVWGQDALRQRTSETLVSLYALLNPIATVCESYRRTLVYGQHPEWDLVGLSSITTALMLTGGYWVFKKLEPGFADVA